MKIERLKKNHKKEIIIGAVITLGIVSALTLTTTRAKYRLTQSIKIVEGDVHYKVPDMRIVAINVSEDGTNYSIQNDLPTGNYELNTEKTACKVATETSGIENAPKDNNVTIEYKDGKINILGVTKKGTRCYLYFDKISGQTSETIIASIKDTAKDSPTTFDSTAENDEGIFKVADGMYGGTSYYWRGAATTNHVIFAGKCWRIIRINGDKTIRLIYNGTPTSETCPGNGTNEASIAKASQTYNSSYSRAEYVGWTWATNTQRTLATTNKSNAMLQTESWFDDNNNFTAAQRLQVVAGKFCNDRNVQSGSWASQPTSTFYYAAKGRLESTKTPTLDCPSGDVYTLKVGAITADEVVFAGGVYGSSNDKYYLYNGQYYWTMSPYCWYYSSASSRYARVFRVCSDGTLHFNYVYDASLGIRPVINLRSDITFNSGSDGTQNSPYIVN